MAWIDLIKSINRAAHILNRDITEADIPTTFKELVILKAECWAEVYSIKRRPALGVSAAGNTVIRTAGAGRKGEL